MRYEHIVWDFNGTLIDDVSLGVAATNILLARRGIPEIDLDVYYREFGFPVKDYYTRIGFDFSKERYEDIADEWIIEYRRLEHTVSLREGVLDLLFAFGAEGIPQTVLSASEQKMLDEQLTALGICPIFECAVGRSDVHATDKTALARAFAEKRRPGRTLMIGDTDHDAACAKAAGFDCALVAGGHQPRARLEQVEGVRIFDSFSELLSVLRAEGTLPPMQVNVRETDGEPTGDIITPVSFSIVANGNNILASVHPHFRETFDEMIREVSVYPTPFSFFERLTERLSTEISDLGYEKDPFATCWGYHLCLQEPTEILLKTDISSTLSKETVDNCENLLFLDLKSAILSGCLATAVIENGKILSAAVTQKPLDGSREVSLEITVETHPSARGRGYASACVAALSRELLAREFFVNYSCRAENAVSLAVAKKVGFRECAQFYRFVGRRK